MAGLFNKIQIRRPKYNKFNLSHEKKLSFKMGELVPIMCEEVVPGDRIRNSTEVMLRMAPMLAPIMHRVNVHVHNFFVPNRIVFDGWEDWITGGPDGEDATNHPKVHINYEVTAQARKGTLADYLGIPAIPDAVGTVDNLLSVSALPFRGYQMIYNEYYRDQNLEDPIDFNIDSANPASAERIRLMTLRRRAWEKDYFTSALPWAQRGADVNLPVDSYFSPQELSQSEVKVAGSETPSPIGGIDARSNYAVSGTEITSSGGPVKIKTLDDPQIIDATSVTINELRVAVRLQEWLEKNARAGSRYIEQILSHFGVRSSDSRLQRPEYIGGSIMPVMISEVLNTAGGAVPQGDMTGHGLSVGSSGRNGRKFEEHGYFFTIMSVIPKSAYMQGCPRKFTKFDRYEYFWPEFAHLGEQAIRLKELYHDYSGSYVSDKDSTWAYQSRYAEYKQAQSQVHGDFRDDLDFWHMARNFAAEPSLNSSFVQCNPDDRIFAVQDGTDTLWAQVYNRVDALRLIPYFNIPRL